MSRRWVIAVVAMLTLAGAKETRAQAVPSAGSPKQPISPIASGDQLPVEHLFGDWRGERSALAAAGVGVDLSYESETTAITAGGIRHGVDYADSITLKTDFDLAKLAGATGLELHAAAVDRVGHNASADFLNEHLTQVEEIYGSGGSVVVHLAYLFAERKLAADRVDLEGGRLDVGQDFATSPLYCEFMTLSDCPSPRLLSIDPGFSIFPSSTWGTRAKLEAGSGVAIQLGAYQVRPTYGGRSGFDFSSSGTTGVFLPGEADWTARFGSTRLVGHYKLGFTYDSSRYPLLTEETSAVDHSIPLGRGQSSWYALFDQMLARTGPEGTDGVILLGGYSGAQGRTATVDELEFLGLLAKGVIPGRAGDSVGLQVVHFAVSAALAGVQAREEIAGLPLSAGSADTPAPFGPESAQTMLEFRYDCALVPGLHAMPDLQYVIHPDAVAREPNATAVSLQLTLDL